MATRFLLGWVKYVTSLSPLLGITKNPLRSHFRWEFPSSPLPQRQQHHRIASPEKGSPKLTHSICSMVVGGIFRYDSPTLRLLLSFDKLCRTLHKWELNKAKKYGRSGRLVEFQQNMEKSVERKKNQIINKTYDEQNKFQTPARSTHTYKLIERTSEKQRMQGRALFTRHTHNNAGAGWWSAQAHDDCWHSLSCFCSCFWSIILNI